jgi:hypothetical protein
MKQAVAVAFALSLSGCASITGSELQSLLVSAKGKNGESVEKAECALQSPRGAWRVTTPSSVMIVRSADDMQVECKKDGHPAGLAKLISRAHGGMYGNIIFGGGIGAIIDHNKGTGYEYPNVAVITMGDSILIDRRDEVERERTYRAPSGGQASGEYLTQDPPRGSLEYGKIAYVDDGSCPAGEVKEVTGGNDRKSVPRTVRCVKRPDRVIK